MAPSRREKPSTPKRTSKAAELTAERFGEFLEAAPDALLEVDGQGRVVLANAEAVRMFQRSHDELLGLSVEQLIPERYRHGHVGQRSAYAAQPTRRPMGRDLNLFALRKDGTEFAVDINLSPLAGADHVMCVIRDVTERRLADEKIQTLNQNLERRSSELAFANAELSLRNREVERANRLKSEFLASMSHELRTPLNTILGFSELLAEGSAGTLNEKQKRFLTHIQRDAAHLLELINDILDLSKIEAGRMELHLEKFPMAVAAAEVLTSIRPLAASKSLALDSDVDTTLMLHADRVRFKEILYNLFSNAIKFTPAGGRVWIETSVSEGSVYVVVGDTGIGIAPEDQAAIFESFRQANATTKGVREGTGLGLAITKRLVEHHGGRIWVESRPDMGSRFFLTLPLAPESVEEPSGETDIAAISPGLLIVSSHVIWRDELANFLRHEGVRTSMAASAGDALHAARETRPNLILLDMELSGRSGWEALHDLKSSPEASGIPVLIVSQTDETKMGKALGAAGCLTKPVSGETLMHAVRGILRPDDGLQVLIVEDDPETRQLVADTLLAEGHAPLMARNVTEAHRVLSVAHVDAIILDLVLGGRRTGFDLLTEIRADDEWKSLPVLVLTVKDLSDRERETLTSQNAEIFAKGAGWRPAVLERLRKLARPANRKTVLVADDNPVGLEMVREGLRDHVASLIEATDGREALKKVREMHPDVVLLDIQMPEMNGFEVLNEIRADPSLDDTRVVALTAFAMHGDRERAIAAGFDDYITKPMTFAKLKAQLELPRGAADGDD